MTAVDPRPWLAPIARRVPLAAIAPLAIRLDRAQDAAVDAVIADHADVAAQIRRLLDRASADGGDPRSRGEIDALTRGMRKVLRRHGAAFARRVDAWVQSESREIMDLSLAPAWLHAAEMRWLDKLNRELGSYAAWADGVLEAVGGVPWARIEDVAAGSGGFVRWLARHSARRDLVLSCSDLSAAYVAAGEAIHAGAPAWALPVRFARRDATQLAALRGQVDLITCTQSTHHMGPGLVVQLIDQALRVAPRGIVVIDVLRSAGVAVGAAVVAHLSTPAPPLVWDAVQSARRGLLPAELTLYARLAGASRAKARAVAPAFVAVHARSDAAG